MKKQHFYLITLLCLLLGATYFLVENTSESDPSLALSFNQDELVSLVFPNFVVNKKDDKYLLPGEGAVDVPALEKMFQNLSNLKVIRVLDFPKEKIDDYFPENPISFKFKFKAGEMRYRFGKRIPLSEYFYLGVENTKEKSNKLLIVANTIDLPYIANPNGEPSPHKYQHFLSLINLPERYFYPKDIINPDLEISNVMLKSAAVDAFYINFKKIETTPAIAIEGIEYDKAVFDEFYKKLRSLRASEILPNGDLDGEIATLSFNHKDKTYKLYRKLDNKIGFYIKADDGEQIYLIDQKKADLFFLKKEDFWNLVAINDEGFGQADILFDMVYQDQTYKLIIPKSKTFEIKMQPGHDKKGELEIIPRYDEFKKIFSMLTTRKAFPPGRVSYLSETYEKKFSKHPGVLLNFKDFSIDLRRLDYEFIITHKQKRFNLHYYVNKSDEASLGISQSDYFYFQ